MWLRVFRLSGGWFSTGCHLYTVVGSSTTFPPPGGKLKSESFSVVVQVLIDLDFMLFAQVLRAS